MLSVRIALARIALAFAITAVLFVPSIYSSDTKAEEAEAKKIQSFRGLIGRDKQGAIISVILRLPRVNKQFESLDDAVESIDFSAFGNLKSVSLESSKMSDRSLVHLQNIPTKLVNLEIVDGSISDKALVAFLKRQPNLVGLEIRNTQTSDDVMVEVAKLDLLMLTISNTRITNKGIADLKNLKSLFFLDISGTSVSDVGVNSLSELKELQNLNLSGTKVTDKGILHLSALHRLQSVNLRNTAVSEKGKQALRNLLPAVQVE